MKLLIGKIMEDYEMTMETIEYYKNKACKVVGNKCDKCETKTKRSWFRSCAFKRWEKIK